jgi:hypothetical protein
VKHPQALYGEPDLKLGWLSIWTLSREFADSVDYDDANWINIHAHIEAPGSRIDIQGPWIRSDEISSFRDELSTLNLRLEGVAHLRCLEPYINAKVTSAALGHLDVVIEATPDPMTQTHRFELELDQSYLPGLIAQCAQILRDFPIKGNL